MPSSSTAAVALALVSFVLTVGCDSSRMGADASTDGAAPTDGARLDGRPGDSGSRDGSHHDAEISDGGTDARLDAAAGGTVCFETPPPRFDAEIGGRVLLADFDRDGHQDVVLHQLEDFYPRILFGDGSGGFGAPSSISIAAADPDVSTWQLHAADVTGDGHPDLVGSGLQVTTSGERSQSMYVVPSDGSRGFGAAIWTERHVEGRTWGPASTVTELDGDSRPDAAIVLERSDGSRDLELLSSDGSGGFTLLGEMTVSSSIVWSSASADLNGDGAEELLLAESEEGIGVLVNDGSGRFSGPTLHPNPRPYLVRTADVNGDGNVDVLTTNFNDGALGLLLGRGDATLEEVALVPLPISPLDLVVGRFDGDESPDLAVESVYAIAVLPNDGSGGFPSQEIVFMDRCIAGLGTADFDEDGRDDLLVSTCSGELVVLLGRVCPGR